MASNTKKPRKRYVPKNAYIPMVGATHDRLSLKFHMSIEALISHTSIEAYNAVMAKLAAISNSICLMRKAKEIISHRDPVANAMRTACLTMSEIWDRWEATGTIYVTDINAKALRNTSGVLDGELARIPKNVLDASILHTSEREAAYQLSQRAAA